MKAYNMCIVYTVYRYVPIPSALSREYMLHAKEYTCNDFELGNKNNKTIYCMYRFINQ